MFERKGVIVANLDDEKVVDICGKRRVAGLVKSSYNIQSPFFPG